jgi:hypothetical protein
MLGGRRLQKGQSLLDEIPQDVAAGRISDEKE